MEGSGLVVIVIIGLAVWIFRKTIKLWAFVSEDTSEAKAMEILYSNKKSKLKLASKAKTLQDETKESVMADDELRKFLNL